MITDSGTAVFPKHHEFHTGHVPTISDIAIGLGSQFRFAGQTDIKYDVLKHSIVVSRIIEPEYAVHGLIHDAAEAIMGDVPTHWKPQAFKDLEAEIVGPFSESLGIAYPWSAEAQAAVDLADYSALQAEAHIAGHRRAERFWPKHLFTDQTRQAFDETISILQEYPQGCFLDSNLAARVFNEALENATARLVAA